MEWSESASSEVTSVRARRSRLFTLRSRFLASSPLALAFAPPARKGQSCARTHAAFSLSGKTIVFTGTFTMTRVDATNAAESAGAKVDPSVTENTSIRVAGWGAGTEEDDDAKAKGVEIWTEDQFVAAASGGKQKDASSAEEQEEAPTAKEAKPDEQLRVRARDGVEVMLSRDAARLMGTLKDLMDLATSEDGIYPTPTIMASTFQMVCKLNDPDYTWPSWMSIRSRS